MNKKLYITESQFKEFILEELSIANEVIEVSNEIIQKIYEGISKDLNEFTFDAPYNTMVNVKIYAFNNNNEFSNWLDNDGVKFLYNGFSFNENTFYFTCVKINDEIDISIIENNVFHEVEHLIQSIKQGKPITSNGYDVIVKHLNDFNPVISTVCNILYYTKKFELDATINGFYSDLKKFDLGRDNITDIIKDTECGKLINMFIEWKKSVQLWTRTPLINDARKKLFEFGIIKDIELNTLKQKLIKKINNAHKYLLKRVGKVYSYAKKEHDSHISDLKIKDLSEAMFWSRVNINLPVKMKDDKSVENINELLLK